ncbi:hypothetical protein AX17_005501 [Amanita inopinata Kibby_2008]|nr:hypothetical protein AX17_005501 [Amanita inopinata Kibby_2008]
MVYIHSWQEYQDAAEVLYAKSPNKARYCVKWNSSEGKLVLKITDDTSCIKFKTYSSIFLNRFEALNLSLMQKMQNKRPEEPHEPPSEPQKPEMGRASPMPGTTLSQAGPSMSGVAKKKKPKKKK